MLRQLESQIQDLQTELAGVRKDQGVLRLQPCRGDSEIKEKNARLDELDRRAKALDEIIKGLTRRRRLLLSESALR